jgi:cell division septum initiation protein DivIVA
MSKRLHEMMQVNIKGRAFAICQSRGITDPDIINYYAQILEQATLGMLTDESSAVDFNQALNEQAVWLEQEIDQLTDVSATEAPASNLDVQQIAESEEEQEKRAVSDAQKQASGYVPEAKTMADRLQDRRTVLEHLLLNDCITLKLVTPNQAKKHIRELIGKDPEKAEEELVASLRNVLHGQVSKFIRKHNGGPWNTHTEQTEIRMQIATTKTLQSLVNLSKMLLSEREEWMAKSKNSLVGRLFGGRVNLD